MLAAQQASLEAIRPGEKGEDVDAAARKVIDDAGHGDHFGHGLGHGVGLDIHEGPRLSLRSDDVLATNEVVTVEPGIYLAGDLGVRIEDLVVVTDDGLRNLSRSQRADLRRLTSASCSLWPVATKRNSWQAVAQRLRSTPALIRLPKAASRAIVASTSAQVDHLDRGVHVAQGDRDEAGRDARAGDLDRVGVGAGAAAAGGDRVLDALRLGGLDQQLEDLRREGRAAADHRAGAERVDAVFLLVDARARRSRG